MNIHYTPQEDKELLSLFLSMAENNGLPHKQQTAVYGKFCNRILPYINGLLQEKTLTNMDSEDVLQQVVLKVLCVLQADRLATQEGIIAYIVRALENMITDLLRKKTRASKAIDPKADIDEVSQNLPDESSTYYSEILPQIPAILGKMSKRNRIIMNALLNSQEQDILSAVNDTLARAGLRTMNDGAFRTAMSRCKNTFIEIAQDLGLFAVFLLFLRTFTPFFL